MSLIDWLIVVVPVAFVLWIALYTRKYIRGVSDFLAAGRICGRYVISAACISEALSIIGVVAYVEVHYKTGFAVAFWGGLKAPVTIFLGLLGYCVYRFRETKAMSIGQFLEMRYNRPFRIFAASLRSVAEIIANCIMPAIAARFFIYFLDLPKTFQLFGQELPTFLIVVAISLSMAFIIISMGGTLALIITDAIQGIFMFPLVITFVVFLLYTFNWSGEIIPVLTDRVQGESFLNPYDVSNLRDFNLFSIFVAIFVSFMHRASWIGAGTHSAAKSPHEQKMAGILGTWRNAVHGIFYVLLSVTIITMMNHRNWAPEAKVVRDVVSGRISEELIPDKTNRELFDARIKSLPVQEQQIGVDAPLSQKANLETPLFNTAKATLNELNGEAAGNAKFQEFRTLFNQQMMSTSMRNLLPVGLLGLFCLLMVLAMISTDDSRIYSAALTITQDVIVPLKKRSLTPRQHLWTLRLVSLAVCLIFLVCSYYMAQMDYIQLFITIVCSMWLGGCGPVMIFGLYSRFGTTAGAFASLISGMGLSVGGILIQRNWAAVVYPFLDRHQWVEPVGNFLTKVSSPLNPYIVWKMDAVKFPINSYEVYFITMLVSTLLYIIVSYMTKKESFNLERMLHRGIYNLDGEKKKPVVAWSLRTFFSKMIGITPEYTTGDKVIAYSVFSYSFIYCFLISFVLVVVWNAFSPWPIEWWSKYFFINSLILTGIIALISSFWFGIGGVIDIFKLFRDLKTRLLTSPLDNGQVEGHVSISDKKQFEQRESEVKDEEGKNREGKSN
jgi:SSS family solute:Na+ symporter